MPFNGSEYILSCIVTVDGSVNTDITISSQWLGNGDMDTADTMSNNTESEGDLEQQHSLTFSPLRSQDDGMYTCTTTISPEENNEFINQTTVNKMTHVTVKSK